MSVSHEGSEGGGDMEWTADASAGPVTVQPAPIGVGNLVEVVAGAVERVLPREATTLTLGSAGRASDTLFDLSGVRATGRARLDSIGGGAPTRYTWNTRDSGSGGDYMSYLRAAGEAFMQGTEFFYGS